MAFLTHIKLLTPTIRSMMVRSPRACLLRPMNTSLLGSSASAIHKFDSPPPSPSQPPPQPLTQPNQVDLLSSDSALAQLVPIQESPLTGAVLPFSSLNFLQVMLFPYTYAVMYYMDFLLNYLPWWQAIILTTATARLVFFPLVVRQNVIGIKTFNLLPETQKIQIKVNEALAAGDAYNQALARTKLQILYKEHGLSMKDRLMPILIQAPMYMSIFFLLRTLTSVPAEGLTTGGTLWFTNLTVPDPLFILPAITCSSMFLLLEFGMEGSMDPKQGMAPIGRYLMRSLPFVMFLFIHNFPAATLLFWSTSNIFTLSYAMLMKNSWVKQKLNIPARLKHDPASLPLSNISMRDQFKDTMEKAKVKRTSMDVRRLDDIAFRKAGVGPLRKTYKEPPKHA
uniref:Mitochondrial inner membrane protein OXA1L n=1 Tax=Aceria tosichella TaxID=561515 RepID=A0A6G1SCR7_9ACAR